MATELPGLEGISLEELFKTNIVFLSEADVPIKYMVMRAAAIAVESLYSDAEPTRSSWVSYLPEVDRLRNEDIDRVRAGGANIYLSTLFAVMSMIINGNEPESYDDIVSYVKDNAPSEETGRFLAEGFECYDVDGSLWKTYLGTLKQSVDQRDNASAVADAVNEAFADNESVWPDTDRCCHVVEDYLEAVTDYDSIIDALDEAIYSDAGESDIFYEDESVSSELHLINALLNADDNDTVACFGPGMSRYHGGGIVTRYCEDWKTIASWQLFTRHFSEYDAEESEFVCARALDVIGNDRYDRIAWDFPLGRRSSALEGASRALAASKQGLPEYGRALSADWTCARLVIDALNDDGRAVVQVSDGALMNGADARIRRHFLDNGWIEGVVSLPDVGGVKRSLLVLSFGNDDVKFVDAGQKPGNSLSLSDSENKGENHKYFMLSSGYTLDLYNDCDNPTFDGGWEEYGERRAICIPVGKIDDECLLNVSHYLQAELLLENPVRMEEVAEWIGRGTSLSARDVKMLATPSQTQCKFLALSDIKDGRKTGRLLNLAEIEEKEESHCAKNGDVLISRGEPMVVAVAEIPEGETWLVNGNMFILRFDPEYMNPYYAAAFLSSRLGQEVARRMRVGTKLKTLPRKKLKKMQIPLLPMREQLRIATEYQAKLDEIEVLNLRISRAREEVLMAFNREG